VSLRHSWIGGRGGWEEGVAGDRAAACLRRLMGSEWGWARARFNAIPSITFRTAATHTVGGPAAARRSVPLAETRGRRLSSSVSSGARRLRAQSKRRGCGHRSTASVDLSAVTVGILSSRQPQNSYISAPISARAPPPRADRARLDIAGCWATHSHIRVRTVGCARIEYLVQNADHSEVYAMNRILNGTFKCNRLYLRTPENVTPYRLHLRPPRTNVS